MIITMIITIIILLGFRIWINSSRKTINSKRLFLESTFDVLWVCMIYIYPFIIRLLDADETTWLPEFLLNSSLEIRGTIALLLLFWIPWLLSYGKLFFLKKLSKVTSPYFWIGNTAYFIFWIPILAVIINWFFFP